jgi:transcriptional regulator with XRE-family HTH domain
MQRNSDNLPAALKQARQRDRLTQAAIADKLGISQSTVSRREKSAPKRQTAATGKLCSYAETSVARDQAIAGVSAEDMLKKICSKSDAHAAALSKIIQALAELYGVDKQDEEEPG